MPKVTNAQTTYEVKGNREDLSNSVYNIDPFDTPIMSMAKRRNAKNRTFDWQTENLPVVDPNNAQVEGFELVRTAAQNTVRLTNVCQISKRDATVSGSQQEANQAGIENPMAHQMAMKSKALKNDMEAIMSGRQARVDGEDTTPTARKTEAIGHFIARGANASNVQGDAVIGVVSGLPLAAGDAFPAVAGASQLAFIEKMIGDGMQKAYEHGASPSNLIVPPSIKRTVSTFTGRSSSQVLVGKTEVVATVDVIATDFGRIKVLPSRWLPADVAYILDPNYIAVAFYRNFRQFPIAKIGDADTRVVLAEWGIEMRNPMAHIMFNGVKQGAVTTVMTTTVRQAGDAEFTSGPEYVPPTQQ